MNNKYRKEIEFGLWHDPKPIRLMPDELETIKMLLWYVPNVKTFQSYQDPLISEKYITDELFWFFCNLLELEEQHIIVDKRENVSVINETISNLIPDEKSLNLIMSLVNGTTKIHSLLDHLRNSLAHGRFTIREGMFLGFDAFSDGQYNFFIHVRASALYKTLMSMRPNDSFLSYDYKHEIFLPNYVEHLIGKTISQINGYEILTINNTVIMAKGKRPDLYIKYKKRDVEIPLDIVLIKADITRIVRIIKEKAKQNNHSSDSSALNIE